MGLSIKDAKELDELGFRRAKYEDKVCPTDIYEYNGELWSIGGRIIPDGSLICDEDIYKSGVWIPNVSDLIFWVEDNKCTYDLKYSGLGYKIEIVDPNGKVFKAKAGTLEYTLFKAIIIILKEYGGDIIDRYSYYKIIESEIIKGN